MTWQRTDLSAPEYEQPTEPPAICDLIYLGKRHAGSGPPEAAKTLTALIFGLEHQRAGGTFALIDFEMGEYATRLLFQELGATLDEIAAVYYVAAEAPPTPDDIEAMSVAGVTFAAIDAAAGAYNVSGLDDNKRADAEVFARAWVNPLWKRGIATLLLDHVTKNPDSRGDYAIGSERKLGAIDVHLGFDAIKKINRGGSGIIKITTRKDRPAHLPRPTAAILELRSDPKTHAITWEFLPPTGTASDQTAGQADIWRPTVLMQRVVEYVKTHPPLKRSPLADAVMGKRVYLLQAIDFLLEDGILELDDHKHVVLVPVPGNVPGNAFVDEEGNNVPRSPSTGRNDFRNENGNVSDDLEDLLTKHQDIAEGTAS